MIHPNWSAPAHVHAFTTTRDAQIKGKSGVSLPPFDGFNLATHVGDDAHAVASNRALLRELVPSEPLWLNQTHGIEVFSKRADSIDSDRSGNAATCKSMESDPFENNIPEADAVLVTEPNQVAVIMTADCLPVLFTTRRGTMVAGAHAGWRSLVGGVLERTVDAMQQAGAQTADIIAWMGPAIGAQQFEIGAEVRTQFISENAQLGISEAATTACFQAHSEHKFLADIYALARLRLHHAGVSDVQGGQYCTVSDAQRFYSYRRDGVTGRMASVIWFE